MKILGIHDGHTSTACLLEDGRILAAVSEERMTQTKGKGGFPEKSVAYILKRHKLDCRDIDQVALVGHIRPLENTEDYQRGRQKYFPTIVKYLPVDPRLAIAAYIRFKQGRRLNARDLVSSFGALSMPMSRIKVIEHHQTHAAATYYLSPFQGRGEKVLVITLDGSGDGLSGTVSIVGEDGQWQRVRAISTFDSLGIVYSRVTQMLGMKPWEHEYKLMGMAPYAHKGDTLRCLKILKSYLELTDDGLGLKNKTRLWGNSLLVQMYKDFMGHRFDAVAAGVQLFHEEVVVKLVRNWIEKTGVRKVAVAGGCFMNVKANKLIAEMSECENLFVMPSCGDESCAIGAALWVYEQRPNRADGPIQPLESVYWGPEYSRDDIEAAVRRASDKVGFRASENIELESAKILAEHKIIGRLAGRMEWGARALGNRSILANPSRVDNIRKLNAAVKLRDFWMPFSPSILWEMRKDYAVYKKDSHSYFMMLTYDSTQLAREHLIAALHPYDLTMRPQFVKKEHNPRYYALLSHFKELTSIGGILNTSFNLHGFPIVNTPEEAIGTFLNSELDYLTINDYIVWKR
jgi:carbamoyltransferase